MEWLDAHQPEYVDRLAELVEQGRIEIVGGAFFEPILAMIPSPRSHRPDPQLHPLAAKPAGRHGPRHVDARTRLGAVVHPRPGRRRHRIHGARRLPLQVRRPDRRRSLHGYCSPKTRAGCCRSSPAASGCGTRFPSPIAAGDDRLPGARSPSEQPDAVVRLRRRRREVRHLAGNEEARLRRRLAGAVLRRPGRKPGLDPSDHAGRGDRQRAAGGQDLSARLQLPRDDRMGAAGRAAGRVRADRARDAGRSALARAAAVRRAAASGGTSR